MKVRTKARRDAIINEAAALFPERGYERTSMNELAKRIGGSKATLYGYFPSKEVLFTAVVRTYATQHLVGATTLLEQPISLTHETFISVLADFGEHILQVLTHDDRAMDVYRMVVAESGRTDIGLLFYHAGPQECLEKLSQFLASAMINKILREADPGIKALQFLALLTAKIDDRIFRHYFQPMSTPRIREISQSAVEQFLHGA